MSKILKNNTASPVLITDTGQTVPASGQLTIDPSDYALYTASNDVITLVGNSTLTVNDGTNDLTISDGSKLIQGIYPNEVSLKDLAGNPVGVTDDAVNVHLNILDADSSADPNNAMPVTLSAVQDMTNRVKIAQANRIIETTWQSSKQPESWTERLTGGATLTHGGQVGDPAYLKAECTLTAGDKVEFQSNRYLPYSPFRTHILTMATSFGAGDPNVRKRLGQFTDSDGWFFEQHGTDVYIVTRNSTFLSSGTDQQRKIRSEWNIDSFDGTGPSGLTISSDFRNDITFIIEFAWHGTQGIKFGIQYFDKIYWAHFVKHSDTNTKPFSRTAMLPIRYEMENTGIPSTAPVWWIGPNSFNIEGGEELQGLPGTATNGVAGTSIDNSSGETVLIAVRPKLQINGAYNRGSIIPLDFNILTTDNILYRVYDQVVFTNGTWSAPNSYSIAEYSLDCTPAGFTNGFKQVTSGFVPAGSNKAQSITNTFESSVAGYLNELNNNALTGFAITAEKINNNLTAYAAINWKEVY